MNHRGRTPEWRAMVVVENTKIAAMRIASTSSIVRPSVGINRALAGSIGALWNSTEAAVVDSAAAEARNSAMNTTPLTSWTFENSSFIRLEPSRIHWRRATMNHRNAMPAKGIRYIAAMITRRESGLE